MDGIDAGRLMAFACDETASPGSTGEAAEYTRLINRYLREATFRKLVDDVLEGVSCEVTDVTPHLGLVLRSHPDGPWCWPARQDDLPWNKTWAKNENDSVMRSARMLVVPALLAYLAPSAADYDDLLADPTLILPSVPVRELERFIRDFAHQREAESPDPAGEERPIWWHWLQLSGETPTAERISRVSTTYVVYDVLKFLHTRGLLKKTSGTSAVDSVYTPRRRLLAHYRDLLVDDLFTSLRRFASERDTSTRPPGQPGKEA
jgi:hypothetical protein